MNVIKLTNGIEENTAAICKAFERDTTFKIRGVDNQFVPRLKSVICYIEGMANASFISDGIIKAILEARRISEDKNLVDAVMEDVLFASELTKVQTVDEVVKKVASGDCAVLLEGMEYAIIIGAKGFQMRSVSEPQNERIIKGPREGFTESVVVNTSLLRKKIQNSDVKFEFLKIGELYDTTVCLTYVDSVVDKNALKIMRERLKTVKSATLLDSNYIAEQIRDSAKSPLKTMGTTERPDVFAAKLLEGRVGIMVDGSPVCLTAPHLFLELFMSSEDYYMNYYYASFQRLLRMVGFLVSLILPALYISLVCFSREMLPTPLALSVAQARLGLPFATITEAFILMIIFDVLRESGARSPSNMGQALSVVSSIVLGQAAIEANLVSSPILIVVAFSGVTSVLIPKLSAVIVICKYGLLLIAGVFGMTGLSLALFVMLAYTASLSSFGVPYMSYFYADKQKESKDIFFRETWNRLKTNPLFSGSEVKNEN